MMALAAGMLHVSSFFPTRAVERSTCPTLVACHVAIRSLLNMIARLAGRYAFVPILSFNLHLLFCFSPSSLLFNNIHPSAAHHLKTPSQPSPKTYNQHVYWTSLILGFFESCLIDSLLFHRHCLLPCCSVYIDALFLEIISSRVAIRSILSSLFSCLWPASSVDSPVVQHASHHSLDSRRSLRQSAGLGPNSAHLYRRQIPSFVFSFLGLLCRFCRVTDTRTRH